MKWQKPDQRRHNGRTALEMDLKATDHAHGRDAECANLEPGLVHRARHHLKHCANVRCTPCTDRWWREAGRRREAVYGGHAAQRHKGPAHVLGLGPWTLKNIRERSLGSPEPAPLPHELVCFFLRRGNSQILGDVNRLHPGMCGLGAGGRR
jgi:hypothetical protein